nr:hypothetical protein [Tanacetum cinerariifolium]
KSVPSGNDKADYDPEEEIRLDERLLYDNSSLRLPEEFNSENYDAIIKSFSPSPIPAEDSDHLMEEIDFFLASDGSTPSGINNDYSDSEGDNLFLERLLHDDHIPLPDTLDFSHDSDHLMEEIDFFLASDGSTPSGSNNDYSDSEGDNLFLERLLHDDHIPLPDTLDFSHVVQVFLPFFTYLVTFQFFSPLGVKTQFLTPASPIIISLL